MKGTGTRVTCGTHTHTHREDEQIRERSLQGVVNRSEEVKAGEQGVFVCPRHEEMSHDMLLTLQDNTPA